MEDYEKLGTFFLGRIYDMQTAKTRDELLLYDSKDLVTHAVCVGMTGSGKTGLCLSLIEEAAIDGIPALLIDPKGDLANLMLTFPNLSAEEFLPWVNPDDAQQKGLSLQDFAAKQAETWKNGLAGWGQDGARIQRLRDAAEVLIYTPGSNAGIPVSILKSFACPPRSILEDGDLLQERISTTVKSLLGLVGIDSEPIQSREHILLSTILNHAWTNGQDLDLTALIQQVQTPPVSKVGVLDLESFYSSKDRFNLVLALNNLLASPGFSTWLEGVPLDISQILYTPAGKPRIAIFSIAHLDDAERMFFVSLFMNQVLGWMRAQSGTTSLRALVYMDEIYGFLPPVENPPSKVPMLTLLKQARAFGLGIVLATQNPVDLDYKALGNAGTWFIGRLQTERDKARLLDGLDVAAASAGTQFNRSQTERILPGLGNRVFLMNNAHEDAPVIFQTRWALSYLRGPLTRDQIKILMDPIKSATPIAPAAPAAGSSQPASAVPAAGILPAAAALQPSALPPDVPCVYIPVRGSAPPGSQLTYIPGILGTSRIHFSDAKAKVEFSETGLFLTPVTDGVIPVVWEKAQLVDIPAEDLERSPRPEARFANLPPAAGQSKNYAAWNRDFISWLYGTRKIDLFFSPSLKQHSQPNESEREFRLRLGQSSREQRDEAAEAMRKKYAARITAIQERIRKADQAKEKQAEQAKQAKIQTAISFGSTLLGAFTGRKLSSSTISRASTAMKGASRAVDESRDVTRAGETVEALQKQLLALQAEFEAEMASLQEKIDPGTETLETIAIKPSKSEISVQLLALAWSPYWQDPQGTSTPAW